MRGTLDGTAWPEGIIQLLDDHHMVVLSDEAEVRTRFGRSLQQQLGLLSDTQVVIIDGAHAVDLPSFCRQIERGLSIRHGGAAPWWRDVAGLIGMLRTTDGRTKRRYFVWNEADALLEADVEMFCRLVNALFGVAAELEHVSPDPLVLQRVIFLGGAKLGAYAEDSHGQFCRWLDDGDGGSPFWEAFSVVDRPQVITYRIDG